MYVCTFYADILSFTLFVNTAFIKLKAKATPNNEIVDNYMI